jgi:ABC-type uncharacterized transport system substrate-binding protein
VEALPRATRIGVVWNPTVPTHSRAVKAVEAAGERLGVGLHTVPMATIAELDDVFASLSRENVGGFLAIASPITFSFRAGLADVALKHRLPGIFASRETVEAGGLISYGADLNSLARRAASYIDKILKGAKPADLPVEQASKYQLVINLKTAKALGLEVPATLLARADEAIE